MVPPSLLPAYHSASRVVGAMFATARAVACLVLAVGCTSSLGPVPTVEGTIVEVTSDPLLILVKPSPNHCGAWVLVDSRTEIRIKSDFRTLPADSDRLRVGVMVSVWGDDELFQASCPGEGRAAYVIIEL